MKTRATIVGAALALMLLPAATMAQDHVIDETANPRFLVVLGAMSGSVEGDALTLVGVPNVLYFSDHPARVAGHVSVADFIDAWATGGDDSFATDPPNAVLSVLADDGPQDVVVELSSLRLDGSALGFTIDVLEGTPPEGPFGPASLFIDAEGTLNILPA